MRVLSQLSLAKQYQIEESLEEQLQQELVLRKERLRMESLFDSASFLLATTDSKGVIITVNREFERKFGYQKKDLTGMLFSNYFVSPPTALNTVFSSRSSLIHQQGHEVSCQVSSTCVELPEQDEWLYTIFDEKSTELTGNAKHAELTGNAKHAELTGNAKHAELRADEKQPELLGFSAEVNNKSIIICSGNACRAPTFIIIKIILFQLFKQFQQ
jgi:PAS domain S-box-containing protein